MFDTFQFQGANIVIRFPGIPNPGVSPRDEGYIYYDKLTQQFMQSLNGLPYVPIGSGVTSLQGAYDVGNIINQTLAHGVVTINNPAATPQPGIIVSQATAGQPSIQASGGNIDLTGGALALDPLGANPAISSRGQVYTKTVLGIVHLFYETNTGAVYQLTPPGGGGGGSLQDAYDFMPSGSIVTSLAGGPLAVSNPAATAQTGFTVSQGTAGQLAALFTGGSISVPDAGANSERFGLSATAAGANGTAIGNTASASAINATAVGFNSLASAARAMAFGPSSSASHINALVIGAGAASTAASQAIFGGSSGPLTSAYWGNGFTSATPSSFLMTVTGGLGAGVAGSLLRVASGLSGDAATAGSDIRLAVADSVAPNTTLMDVATVSSGGTAAGSFLIGTTTPVVGKSLVVIGDVSITGVLDPTALILSPAAGSLYIESSTSTAPVSGAATGRLRYDNTGSGAFQISVQAGPYSNIMTSSTSTLQASYNNGVNGSGQSGIINLTTGLGPISISGPNGILTGTVTITNGSAAVVGVGTQFLTQVYVNQNIRFVSDATYTTYQVLSVTDDLNMTLTSVYTGTTTAGDTAVALQNSLNASNQTINQTVAQFQGVVGGGPGGIVVSNSFSRSAPLNSNTAAICYQAGISDYDAPITGTVDVTNGSAAVVGIGTLFLTEVFVGNSLEFASDPGVFYTVLSITDNLNLTLTAAYTGPTTLGTTAEVGDPASAGIIGYIVNTNKTRTGNLVGFATIGGNGAPSLWGLAVGSNLVMSALTFTPGSNEGNISLVAANGFGAGDAGRGVSFVAGAKGDSTVLDGAITGSGFSTTTWTQNAQTTGSPTLLTLTGGAHTTLAASTEATDVNFNLARTVQFATGALATQRAVRFQAPTYAFVAASTITTAATVAISGAPVAGANATITNAYALDVTGDTRITGKLTVTGLIDPSGLYLDEQGADQPAVANKGVIYTKDVATVTQLFYRASDGTVTQLTPTSGGGGSLQDAYDFTPSGAITLSLAGGPIAISNPAATAQTALTVTQGTAGQLAALFTSGSISCPDAGGSERFGAIAAAAGASATAIGNASTASGSESVAVGRFSLASTAETVAIGYGTASSAIGAVAVGSSASAGFLASIAIGQSALAGAADAIAIGSGSATASGAQSTSIGSASDATGLRAVALGNGAQSTATDSIAIGSSTASANNTISMGNAAVASVAGALAIGQSTTASGGNSVALGNTSSATATSAIAIGASSSAGFSPSVAIGPNATTTATNQVVIGASSNPLTTIVFGRGVTDATPSSFVTLQATSGAGAAVAGGGLRLATGISGDAATGSNALRLAVAVAGTGTALTDVLYVDSAEGSVLIGTATPVAGKKLVVSGDVKITGVLDPTALELATGTNLYIDSTDGTTAANAAASHGRLRYNNTTKTFQVSADTSGYSSIVTSSTIGTTAFIQNGNAFGTLATLGTTDTNALSLITDNTARARILSGGAFLIGATAQGASEGFRQANGTSLFGGSVTVSNSAVGAASGMGNGLDVVQDNATANVAVTNFGVSGVTFSPGFAGRAARGTLAAPTAVQTDDLLVSFNGRGYGTTGFAAGSRGRIGILAAEPWTDSAQGTYMAFSTTAVGATTNTERMRLSSTALTSTIPHLNANGTVGAPSYSFSGEATTGWYLAGTFNPALSAGGVQVLAANGNVNGVSTVTLTQQANTSGAPTALLVTAGAHTTLTASTENVDVNVNLARTVQHATGAIATQRAMVVQAPTYSFVAASTITNAATLAVTAAPVAGTNATITNSYALWVQAGTARFDGTVSHATAAVDSWNNDTGLSRVSANILALGNGTAANATGTLRVTAVQAPAATTLSLGGSAASQLVLNAATTGSPNGMAYTQVVNTNGVAKTVLVTAAAHTNQTASTEVIDVDLNLARTVQHATGALATQRAMVVRAPTYSFVAASTLTNAATLAVTAAPAAGANATITNSYALWVQAGASLFGTSGTATGEIRLAGATSGFVGLTASTAAGSTTYTLPSADGTNGQMLTTNGTATLSWTSPVGGSLDSAYDFGGPGAGRTINADSGDVLILPSTTGGLSVANATAGGIYGGQQFGPGANATGTNSLAIGQSSAATGASAGSMAIGVLATASGTYATAIGAEAVTNGQYTLAVGGSSTATGDSDTAIGTDSQLTGGFSVGVGYQATISVAAATALGYATGVTHAGSIALGALAASAATAQFAIGSSGFPISTVRIGHGGTTTGAGPSVDISPTPTTTSSAGGVLTVSGGGADDGAGGGTGGNLVLKSGTGGSSSGLISLAIGGTTIAQITTAGSFVLQANGALATSATDGFTYLPTTAGTPTGTPTSVTGAAPIVYDTTNSRLFAYDGGWVNVAQTPVFVKTGNYTVLSTDSPSTFTNEGAAGQVILTLPTAVAGLTVTAYVHTAQNLRVKATGSETVRVGATVSGAAGYAEAATVGNALTLIAINSTEWVAISSVGTWTVV